MAEGCLFCQVVSGELEPYLVYSDDVVMAILDIHPLFIGHTLVIPRIHAETITDLPTDMVGPFFERVQMMAAAVRDGMGAQGTFVAMNNIVSQSVPHLHTHVVPRVKGDGLRGFFWPRTKYRDRAHFAEVAATIAAVVGAGRS